MTRFRDLMMGAVVASGVAFGGVASQAQDIVDIVADHGDFKTLAAAVDASGLKGALRGGGPFTVFAPTDEAFAALPAGTVERLLLPENKQELIAVINNHILPGKVMAGDIINKQTSARSLNRKTLRINTLQGGVKIQGAKVVTADIAADNGVIHIIDKVMLP